MDIGLMSSSVHSRARSLSLASVGAWTLMGLLGALVARETRDPLRLEDRPDEADEGGGSAGYFGVLLAKFESAEPRVVFTLVISSGSAVEQRKGKPKPAARPRQCDDNETAPYKYGASVPFRLTQILPATAHTMMNAIINVTAPAVLSASRVCLSISGRPVSRRDGDWASRE
ncbi:hypothetical protein DHEL01_v205703 [Diaporthe helianthi]|uniref:Uncharacterized protein n=1 Tax=Diaporthe helianthi TaxID=158607 RepID=A0A2P5I070_DIAHE|nr:hypothetical protein DHEL01_v205703 [Diaporthe helianthi]